MSESHLATIALGSNLGNRLHHLQMACQTLSERFTLVKLSSIWVTEPLACPPGSMAFLNAVGIWSVQCSPQEVLTYCLDLEAQAGRTRLPNAPRHQARPLDLDLLAYDQVTCHDTFLQLPHPRQNERLFVLAPLREIANSSICEQNYQKILRDGAQKVALFAPSFFLNPPVVNYE